MIFGIVCIILGGFLSYQSLCYYGVIPLDCICAHTQSMALEITAMVAMKWGIIFGILGILAGIFFVYMNAKGKDTSGKFEMLMLVVLFIVSLLSIL